MNDENLKKRIIKYLWLRLTQQMWRCGYGTIWMKKVVDNKGKEK